jgi:hypothetical protein
MCSGVYAAAAADVSVENITSIFNHETIISRLNHACCLLNAGFSFYFFDIEERGDMFLRNYGLPSPDMSVISLKTELSM